MKKLLFYIILFFPFLVVAQHVEPEPKAIENDFKAFRDSFDKDFGSEDATYSETKVISYRPVVVLPEWFVNFNSQNTEVSLGISDPGLDSLEAINQATHRALALASFARHVHIKNVSDNYYLDNEGKKNLGKFNSFTLYLSSDSLAYTLRNSTYTSNGEALVLIELVHDRSRSTALESSIELYQTETLGKVISRIKMETKLPAREEQPLQSSWTLLESSQSYEISSIWENRLLNMPLAKYKYLNPVSTNSEARQDDNFAFDMRYGLWYAYINALVVNMEQMDVFSSQIKILESKYDEHYQDLTRVVFSEAHSFSISGIYVEDNKLSLNLIKITL
jgi:hypothetical protein